MTSHVSNVMELGCIACLENSSLIDFKQRVIHNADLQGFISEVGKACGPLFTVPSFTVVDEDARGFW